jgi:hypothetical protein
MTPFFANQSCDPFTPREWPCTLGNYVSYAVNASSAADVATALKFAKLHNIRIVVRNTGHEYAFSPGSNSTDAPTLDSNSRNVGTNMPSGLLSGFRAAQLAPVAWPFGSMVSSKPT